jgi:hypothetical protein
MWVPGTSARLTEKKWGSKAWGLGISQNKTALKRRVEVLSNPYTLHMKRCLK